MIQERSDGGVLCKTPLGYRDGRQLDSLITLKNYIDGGHEVDGVKVLVAVKSIGSRKSCISSFIILTSHNSLQNNLVTTKKGTETSLISISIFDDTATATLTLWGRTCSSASGWKASETILLLTNPSFKGDRRPTLGLSHNTHVDIDPCIDDAYWLRAYAARLTKRECVNLPFPDSTIFQVP